MIKARLLLVSFAIAGAVLSAGFLGVLLGGAVYAAPNSYIDAATMNPAPAPGQDSWLVAGEAASTFRIYNRIKVYFPKTMAKSSMELRIWGMDYCEPMPGARTSGDGIDDFISSNPFPTALRGLYATKFSFIRNSGGGVDRYGYVRKYDTYGCNSNYNRATNNT